MLPARLSGKGLNESSTISSHDSRSDQISLSIKKTDLPSRKVNNCKKNKFFFEKKRRKITAVNTFILS